jgi:hypothetical protein
MSEGGSNPSRGKKEKMDCFVAFAPRNDGIQIIVLTLIVIPRACGGSSTPRLIGSITGVSGIPGRPVIAP